MKPYPALALAFLLSTPAGFAGVISVTMDVSDQQWDSDGNSTWIGQPSHRVGKTSQADPPVAWDAIFPFALPTIPAGEEISSASLTVNLEGWTSFAAIGPVEVYGINLVSASSTTVFADHFVDARTPGANANAVLLDPSLITDDDTAGTSGSGQTAPFVSADISSFITNLYSLGSAGDFGFITLAVDVDTVGSGSNNYYVISSANNATAEWQPYLTINTVVVPEPAFLASVVGGLALLLVVCLRRRR